MLLARLAMATSVFKTTVQHYCHCACTAGSSGMDGPGIEYGTTLLSLCTAGSSGMDGPGIEYGTTLLSLCTAGSSGMDGPGIESR